MLNAGSHSDDARELFETYHDFELKIIQQSFGIEVEVINAPAIAFVDGEMIRGVKELLFAVLRDIVYISNEVMESDRFDLTEADSITNAVFPFCATPRARRADAPRSCCVLGPVIPSRATNTNTPSAWATRSVCADSMCAPAAGPAP